MMGIKKKFVVLTGMLIIFLILPIVVPQQKYITIQSPNYQLSKVVLAQNSKEITKILNKSYYKGKKYDIFSSTALMNDESNIYFIYWVLRVADEIDYKIGEEYREILTKQYSTLKKNSASTDIDYYLMKVWIAKYLNVEINNSEIIDFLSEHFDSKNNLFYQDSINESIPKKLVTTSKIIDIICTSNLNFEQIERIRKKLIRMYNEDSFFTYNEAEENILNNGGLIVDSLSKLGVNFSSFSANVNAKRVKWFEYWYTKTIEQSTLDWFTASMVSAVNDISVFFNKNTLNNELYLDRIIKEEENINSFGNSTGFNIEPQYLFEIIKIYHMSGKEFPFINGVNEYVTEVLETEFSKWILPSVSMNDIYYGLKIARTSGFYFNKMKIESILKSVYSTMLPLDNYSEEELSNIYYVLLSFKEMNILIDNPDYIKKYLDSYLENIISAVEVENHIDEISHILEMYEAFNFKMSYKVVKKIEKVYGDLNNYSDNFFKKEKNIIYLFNIIAALDTRNNHTGTLEFLGELLKNFKTEYGYKSKNIDGGEADIISTTKATLMLKELKQDVERDKISIFLSNVKSDKFLFKLSPASPDNYTDLEVIYNGILLVSIINRG